MECYQNLSGNSGVTFYDIGKDCIVLTFKTGGTYVYDYTAPGKAHVEAMKQLAIAGKGLSTYINRHVRENYARQL